MSQEQEQEEEKKAVSKTADTRGQKMYDLGIIQKVQQYQKLLRISWWNCL